LIYIKTLVILQEQMTKRQKELLDYIRKYVKKNEMSPTYREMVKALNSKSVSNIGRMLDALAEEGKITRRIPAKPRSIKVL
jgi:repressor LexA